MKYIFISRKILIYYLFFNSSNQSLKLFSLISLEYIFKIYVYVYICIYIYLCNCVIGGDFNYSVLRKSFRGSVHIRISISYPNGIKVIFVSRPDILGRGKFVGRYCFLILILLFGMISSLR